ncbi:MAG: bifunctional 5,10-methylenetetrahydrofolate dehydrogenase/5,10-methenyltetrahydrofolate cyclohydrolase [Thaumarchaeota archaeon]|nr:bifunctional 5,10-methylenetetrahydrofolate dehydrogenase/5,10-methenyltetrahydrofolate cyclohydrolase [Nitrososphaerota archaeon]
MTGQKLDGILVANTVKDRIRISVEELGKEGIEPCLATILIGEDPASTSYVTSKQKDCADVGIHTKDHRLPQNFSQAELGELIELLNRDKTVHGILVQLPLPKQLDEFEVISKISPVKDVDGLTPFNSGLLASERALLKPCTPSGIMEILDFYKINVAGRHAVIINRSNLVGKPLYHLMLEKDATVTTCHSKTPDLKSFCLDADILVSAVGNRDKFTLTADMVKEDAVVIDVGTSRIAGRVSGDVDYPNVIEKASYVTPVPGGVGPMTRAMLLKNTITAASTSKEIVAHGRESTSP